MKFKITNQFMVFLLALFLHLNEVIHGTYDITDNVEVSVNLNKEQVQTILDTDTLVLDCSNIQNIKAQLGCKLQRFQSLELMDEYVPDINSNVLSEEKCITLKLRKAIKTISCLLKYGNMILPAFLYITSGFIMQLFHFAVRKYTRHSNDLYLDIPAIMINCLLLYSTPYRWKEYFLDRRGEMMLLDEVLPRDPIFYVQPILMASLPIILDCVRNERYKCFWNHVKDHNELFDVETQLLDKHTQQTQMEIKDELEKMFMYSSTNATTAAGHMSLSIVILVLKVANCMIPALHDPHGAGAPYIVLSLLQALPFDIETYFLLLLQNIGALIVFRANDPSSINLDWNIFIGLSIIWNVAMWIAACCKETMRYFTLKQENRF